MTNNNTLTGLLLVLAMTACSTQPKSETQQEEKTAVAETPAQAAPAEAAPAAPVEIAAAPAAMAAADPEPPAPEPTPPNVVESCKDEPYVNYEQQARESLAKGLAATEAGSYGVGFRDGAEHKKWTATHQQLFAKVNTSCQALSDCAKQSPKDKEAQCAEQAKTFAAWQALAARFAEKAKLAETTQPPLLCSFEPNLNDASHCFHELAANVDKSCGNAECKELSACWNGVGFLDTAIAQAERACGFVHEALDTCRGYIEAKGRREKKFTHCQTLRDGLNLPVIPVL